VVNVQRGEEPFCHFERSREISNCRRELCFRPWDNSIPKNIRKSNSVVSRLVEAREALVDAPEEEAVYANRIAEQAAYFGISPNEAIEVGHEASEFTKQALAKPFTTQTRWRLALGRSTLPRYYAIVLTATRLERAACERGASANLRHMNTDAGWS
jgi:hypothetical protein